MHRLSWVGSVLTLMLVNCLKAFYGKGRECLVNKSTTYTHTQKRRILGERTLWGWDKADYVTLNKTIKRVWVYMYTKLHVSSLRGQRGHWGEPRRVVFPINRTVWAFPCGASFIAALDSHRQSLVETRRLQSRLGTESSNVSRLEILKRIDKTPFSSVVP